MDSAIWSGTLGFPIPHHYILGFIVAGISIAVMELKSRHERRAKTSETRPHR